jgi:segregation and condensation protein B
VSTDERPESLAAQAAAWVPPWERQSAAPDPAYAASVTAAAATDADTGLDADAETGLDADTDPDEEVTAADDDADEDNEEEIDAEDGDPAGDGEVPAELPPMPGEVTGPVTVDAPQSLPGEDEPDPTDVEPDMPAVPAPQLPDPDDDDPTEGDVDGGVPVDSPARIDGVDAGSVLDSAADDDVSDDDVSDDDIELPTVEPGEVGGAPAAKAAKSRAAKNRAVSGIPVQGRGSGDTGSSAGAAGGRTPERLAAGTDDAGAAARLDDADTLPPIDDDELRAALEAILLVVDEPVGELQLAQIMEQSTERVAAMLEDISAGYTAAGRGFDLRRAAGGWRLYTRPEYAPYVERFVLDGQSTRLTQAALETLAVVAYRQPVTRSRISGIRGVNCDGVMRTLVTRGLIEECGTEPESGAFLYRTTTLFLEKLGLNSVDQLPDLAPFLPDDLEEVFDAQR